MDLTDEARRDHVNRLRPMLASKIDDHACASKRADDGTRSGCTRKLA